MASFALKTILAQYAEVTNLDYFSFLSRKFERRLYEYNLLITDLEGTWYDRISFDSAAVDRSPSELIAFIPLSTAAVFFFRLQRENIPICLWRGGLTPVAKAVQLLFTGASATPESTIDLHNLNYLKYGVKVESPAESIPSHLRSLVPRLNFDSRILEAELGQSTSQLRESIESLHEFFGVKSTQEVIEAADRQGIRQLRYKDDSIEKRILEDNAMSAIANWLAKQDFEPNIAK